MFMQKLHIMIKQNQCVPFVPFPGVVGNTVQPLQHEKQALDADCQLERKALEIHRAIGGMERDGCAGVGGGLQGFLCGEIKGWQGWDFVHAGKSSMWSFLK